MKKWFLKLFLMSVLIFLILKVGMLGWAYYLISDLKQAFSDRVLIQYQWGMVGFDGALEIHGLQINSFDLKKKISADEVDIQFENIQSLASLSSQLNSGQMPRSFSITTTGLKVPLDGLTLMEAFQGGQTLAGKVIQQPGFNPWRVHGCGTYQVLTNAQLSQMGIQELSASLNLQWQFDESTQILKINGLLDLDTLGTSLWQSRWKLPSRSLKLKDLEDEFTSGNAALVSVNLSYHDRGYFRRVSYFCAKQLRIQREDYAQKAQSDWLADLAANGVTVSDWIEQHYLLWVKDGGFIDIQFNPDSPVKLKTWLNHFKWGWDKLHPQIQFNTPEQVPFGIEVSDKNWHQWFDGGSAPQNSTTQSKNTASDISASDNAVPQPPKKRYRVVSLKGPDLYIGEMVKITTFKQRHYQGILTKNDKYSIEITQHMSDGDMAFPIEKNKIIQLQVLK
jgi:hypothetical protein